MQFRVLGAVTVLVDGEPLRIPRRRERLLLAILLLARGAPVAADRLVDLLWGTEPPAQAKRSLHSHVARLRALIKTADAEVELVGSGADYSLRLADPDAVDATRFRSLLAEARDADDPAERIRSLRTALDLWQGDALQDVASAEQRVELCGELEELRTSATEDWAEAALGLGRHGELIPELTALVARFPYRERFVEYLMVALDHVGRRHEALEAYTAMRTRLADELGIDPGPRVQRRHAAILRGAGPVAEPSPDPDPAPRSRPNNHLPRQIPDFTGRADEIDVLCELLRGHDGELVCTIDGMAGVGKTTFAVHMAHRLAERYPDGQVFLDLHGHTPGHRPIEPSDALAALLRQCAVPANRMPDDLAGRAALWRTELAERRVLVVLDNAVGSAQVRHLLPGAVGGLTLITSRRRLTALDGAVPMTLTTLSPAESVALFTKVAGGPTRTGDALDDVVERCAHLPLAIRIAAARLRHRPTWSVAHLAARLADERTTLSELSDSDRSVAAAFTMSYRDLRPDQQRMYRLLGLLPLPMFDSYLAAALADLPLAAAENLIEDLVDAHVVEQAGPDRYQLHDLLRFHAAAVGEAPEHADERQPAIDRGLDYLLHTTLLATRGIDPYRRELGPPTANVPAAVPDFRDDRAAIDWLASRCENVLCAIQFAHTAGFDEHAWLLARAMVPLFFNRGYPTEWIASHRLALASARRSGNRLGEGVTLGNLSAVYRNVGRNEEAHEHAVLSLKVAIEADDWFGQGVASCNIGLSYLQSADHVEAERHFRAALDGLAGRRVADQGVSAESRVQAEAIVSANLGVLYLRGGRLAEAQEMSLHAIELQQRIDDRRNECRSLHRLGQVHLRLDEVDDARACQQLALEMSKELGDLRQQARAVAALGMIDERAGRLSSALAQLHTALELQQANQYRLDEATTLAGLGVVLDRLGRAGAALEHHARASALAEEVGAMDLYVEVRNNAGVTHHGLGEFAESRDHHTAALAMAVELGMPPEQARAYAGLSAVAESVGDRDAAREFLRLSTLVTAGESPAPEPAEPSRSRSA